MKAGPPLAALAVVAGLLCACASWSFAAAASPAAARPQPAARAAILVDAGDGHVLYGRAPRSRHAIASTTKLMTALLALEELPLRRRLAAAPYSAGPAESQIGLRPGERMATVDLLQALLLESANDAAVTLARGAAGSVPRFVARMNRARQNARSARHPLRQPDRSRRREQLLERPGPVASRPQAAEERHLRDHRRLGRPARLSTGARERIVSNRNDLVARVPWIDGVKTGHTRPGRLRAGRIGHPQGRAAGQRRAGRAVAGPPRRRHAGAARLRLRPLPASATAAHG